jgi:hypothetical protein
MEFSTLLSHDEKRIDVYHDGEPLWYCTMKNLLDNQSVPRLVPHDLEA